MIPSIRHMEATLPDYEAAAADGPAVADKADASDTLAAPTPATA